jgi:hypothetical protein
VRTFTLGTEANSKGVITPAQQAVVLIITGEEGLEHGFRLWVGTRKFEIFTRMDARQDH